MIPPEFDDTMVYQLWSINNDQVRWGKTVVEQQAAVLAYASLLLQQRAHRRMSYQRPFTGPKTDPTFARFPWLGLDD